MLGIEVCDLPAGALLSAYCREGTYTDCFVTEIERQVSLQDYVAAFYSTTLFKAERQVLKWAVAKPSTDEQVRALAQAKTEQFAAWQVEDRRDDQILLSDYRGRTRSWLMCQNTSTDAQAGTRLLFGSAVVGAQSDRANGGTLGAVFNLVLPFHQLYARALLVSARQHLIRQQD
jgi:hypothetical protein